MGALILGLFVLSSFIYESYKSYESEIKKAEIQTTNLSQVLEGQIAISFKNIDLVLQTLQDRVGPDSINAKNIDQYNELLRTHSSRLSEVLSIKVINENGDFIADDRGIIEHNLNIADRDYFQEMKANPHNHLVISKPVISRTANIWIIVLARPILTKTGHFKGIIIASITIDHFKTMFDKINIDKEGMIALYGVDKVLYARRPFTKKMGSVVNVAPEIVQLINSTSPYITYKRNSRVDKINRVFTARKMSNYPFVVVSGLSTNDFLAEWRTRTAIHSVIVFLVLSMAAYFLFNFLISLEQVEEQRKQAMQSAKLSSLGEMASGIAHEINNPLSIISMTAKSLRKHRASDADPRLIDGLDRIVSTSDRIAKIVKGLRSFSRDSFDDPFLPVPVNKIIESTLDLCHERIRTRSVFLTVTVAETFSIDCREIQIAQVLLNLLNNSLDSIENDNERWIKVEATLEGLTGKITVTDSGKLIPNHIAEKLMVPFFTTKEVGKGTGLGLSISKGIVESHKGRFYLDRTKPHNTFVIELPASLSVSKAA